MSIELTEAGENEYTALVRDAKRGRYVITLGQLPRKTVEGYSYDAGGPYYATPGDAIDAVMEGK